MIKLSEGYTCWIQVYDNCKEQGIDLSNNDLCVCFSTLKNPFLYGEGMRYHETKISIREIKAAIFDEIIRFRIDISNTLESIDYSQIKWGESGYIDEEKLSDSQKKTSRLIYYLSKGNNNPEKFLNGTYFKTKDDV